MRQVWITRAGAPEVLQVREASDPTPGEGQVRIRVEYAGVNFADVLGRMGLYPDLPGIPIVVGYEVAGVIDAVGPGVDTRRVGEDVLALCRFGGYSDTLCLDAQQAFPRPPTLDAQAGAALPVNYLTAYALAVVMGGLRAGDTMLVHSAGGGVGIAAIQLARHIGARIIGTASAHKHAALRSLGVEHCIDYRTEDFAARVMEITSGGGVELILDAVGGESYARDFRILAPSGRLGMFGMSAAAPGKSRSLLALAKFAAQMPWLTFNPVRLMNDNKGVFGVNLGHMWNQRERIAGWMRALLTLHEQGAIAPRVDAVFSFDDAAAAHHYIQDRKNIGKVLLRP